jgi:hypothetical protein
LALVNEEEIYLGGSQLYFLSKSMK